MKKMVNIRRDHTTKKDTKKVETRRRVVQKRDTTMKTTKDTRTSMEKRNITLIAKSTERREESMVVQNMDSNLEVADMVEEEVEDMVAVIIKNFSLNCFKEALMCLIITQIYFHDTRSMK
jgi:hypothetical protein